MGNSNIKTIQSKICKSLETLNVGFKVETGNLIFSENVNNTIKNKKIITYAVTIKIKQRSRYMEWNIFSNFIKI